MSYRGLVVSPEAAAFLDAGGRDLTFHVAGTGEPLEAGRPLRLVSRAGRALGLALADPENECLRVVSGPEDADEAIGPAFFAARVASALALRRGLGLVGERTAYHALHGAGDSLPGFTADVFGSWAVLYVRSRGFLAHGQAVATELVTQAGLRGCVVKVRSRGAAREGRVRQEVVAEAPPAALVAEERGVPFEVHLERGMNTGLFTDMREHRLGLGRLAAGKRVLNGFSYTGTLSVAAARAGAGEVVSVDLSAGVQGWARDNFRLSGLDPGASAYSFEVSDVGVFLERAAGAGRRFDLVLLDPPAYSAARGAPFAIDRDYPGLVARACRVLDEGGLVWLACNARTSALVDLAVQGFRAARRRAALLESGGLPADHPTLPAQPEDRYLAVALFRVE